MAPQLINNQNQSKDILDLVKYDSMKKTLKNYQKIIKKNFKYVGEDFAYEARSIHYDEKKKKNIYGNPSKRDLKELKDEGIETQMIPWVDDKDS